jgi:hypothetical protein
VIVGLVLCEDSRGGVLGICNIRVLDAPASANMLGESQTGADCDALATGGACFPASSLNLTNP